MMRYQSGVPSDETPCRTARSQTTDMGATDLRDLSAISASEKQLGKMWQANFKQRTISHTKMLLHYDRLDKFLRFVTVAGTGTAAVITENPNFVEAVGGNNNARLIAMSSTVVAAFALTVNSRLRCKERSSNHLAAKDKWRKLDEFMQKYLDSAPRLPQQRAGKMTEVRALCKEALKSSPTVPQWIHRIRCRCRRPKPSNAPAQESSLQEPLNPCDDLEDALVPEVRKGETAYFEEKDVEKLLKRFSQATYIHDETDKLSDWYYALSSTIGSCAGAMSVIALSFQAMSLSGEAPAWCHIVGSMSSVGLFALSITEGAHGFDENWKVSKETRTEFAEMAQELQQALYSQPHVCPRAYAKQLLERAQSLVTKWDGNPTMLKIYHIGDRANQEADGVIALLKKAKENYDPFKHKTPVETSTNASARSFPVRSSCRGSVDGSEPGTPTKVRGSRKGSMDSSDPGTPMKAKGSRKGSMDGSDPGTEGSAKQSAVDPVSGVV